MAQELYYTRIHRTPEHIYTLAIIMYLVTLLIAIDICDQRDSPHALQQVVLRLLRVFSILTGDEILCFAVLVVSNNAFRL